MPAVDSYVIGSGETYTTQQGWEDASPADLTTADKIWQGKLKSQLSVTSALTIGGSTSDSTRYKHLTSNTAVSWQDVLSTSRLGGAISGAGYTASNSATISLTVSENYAVVENIAAIGTGSSTLITVVMSGTGSVLRWCYFRMRPNANSPLYLNVANSEGFIHNNFFISEGSSSGTPTFMRLGNGATSSGNATKVWNNTFANSSTDASGNSTAARGVAIDRTATAGTKYFDVRNNSFIGMATLFSGSSDCQFVAASGYNLTQLNAGATDYTDKFPTGAGGNLYGGDLSGTWTDSNNLVVNTTYANGDWRAFSGGELAGAGVRIGSGEGYNPKATASYTGGTAPTRIEGVGDRDAYGNTKDPTNPWIGAWEDAYTASGGAAPLLFILSMKKK